MTAAHGLLKLLRADVAGKAVALVGNARGLAASGLGGEIDGCGLVIRLNAAPLCGDDGHGVRTDWLASSMFPGGQRLRALRPRRLIWMSPKRRALALAAYGWRLPIMFYPGEWWNSLCLALGGARPSTGMMAIDLLVRAGHYAELRLYGFDFFQSGSLSMRKLASPPPHDFARERELVLGLLGPRNRLRLIGGRGQ